MRTNTKTINFTEIEIELMRNRIMRKIEEAKIMMEVL